MRTLATTVAVLALTATAASANWTGCRVGAFGGAMATNTEVTGGFGPITGSIDGVGVQSIQGGIMAGCDYQAGSMVVGAFADYAMQDADWRAGISTPFGGGSIETNVGNQWALGVRAGYLVTPTTLLYGTAGYTEAKMDDIDVVLNGATVATLGIDDPAGWFVGAGMESMMSKNLRISLEYRYSAFDNQPVDFTSVGLPITTDLETDSHQFRVGLSFAFGGEELVTQTK